MAFQAILNTGLLLFLASQLCFSVSNEERKKEMNRPDSPVSRRGAKSSSSGSSSGSSSSSSSSTSSSSSNSAPSFSYADMGANFSKEMEKSNQEFLKSLPKAEPETDYLKEMEKANKLLGKGDKQELSIESSLLAQYTANIIATIQQTTQIKLNLLAQRERELALEKKAQIQNQERQERAERMKGLSPMAIVLGAAENPLSFKTSPLSTRTQTNQGANHSNKNALFPRGIDSITSRAYKSTGNGD